MIFRESFLTTAGAELLARLNSSGGVLVWTRAFTWTINTNSKTDSEMKSYTESTLGSKSSSGYVTSSVVGEGGSATAVYTELDNRTYNGYAYTYGCFAKIQGDSSDVLVIIARVGTGVSPVYLNNISNGLEKAFIDFTLEVSGNQAQAISAAEGWYATAEALQTLSAKVISATTTNEGLVELATPEEVTTGTDATRAVTPAGLASRTATTDRTGIVELATNEETIAGTDTTRAVTPAGYQAGLADRAVTTHALGATTTGDNQTVYGIKTFNSKLTTNAGLETYASSTTHKMFHSTVSYTNNINGVNLVFQTDYNGGIGTAGTSTSGAGLFYMDSGKYINGIILGSNGLAPEANFYGNYSSYRQKGAYILLNRGLANSAGTVFSDGSINSVSINAPREISDGLPSAQIYLSSDTSNGNYGPSNVTVTGTDISLTASDPIDGQSSVALTGDSINVNGETNIGGNLLPTVNSTSTATGYYLGDSSHKWRYVYAYRGNFSSTITCVGLTSTGAVTIGSTSVNRDLTVNGNATVKKLTIPYGTCSTASSTAAKTVTCTPAITASDLVEGLVVRVKFTYYNYANNPTLNVDSTGAKSIKQYVTNGISYNDSFSWANGAIIEFMYDGSNWVWMNNTPFSYKAYQFYLNSWVDGLLYVGGAQSVKRYATCTTSASTATKVITNSNINIETGTVILVKFTYSNTAASPELSITGKATYKLMQYGTTAIGTTTATSWTAGAVVMFVFDGTNWIKL